MKYGIYFAYWTKEWGVDYKGYVDKVAALGFDVLEVSCAALSNVYVKDEQLYDLKEYAKEKGLVLTAGYGPTKEQNLCSEDEGTVKKAMGFFKNLLPKLQKMDIKILGGGLYSYWPVDYTKPVNKEADWERAVRNIRELAKTAQECDVTLGMEVLNRYEGYMLNTCEEALQFVDEVGSDYVKVMLDTFHMNIEDASIEEGFRKCRDYIKHIHFVDSNRLAPGMGHLDMGGLIKVINEINYSGYLCLEALRKPDSMTVAENGIDFFKKYSI